MYSLIVADGTCGRLYLESNQPTSRTLRTVFPGCSIDYLPSYQDKSRNKGRGIRGVEDFLNQCISDGSLVKGDLLLYDNEPSFKASAVEKLLNDAGIVADILFSVLIDRDSTSLFSFAAWASTKSM
jgi:hypothetical protein